MLDQILKDLAFKVIAVSVVILAVVGFGTYKYVQFKEEEIKDKYVEELSAQRKAHEQEIEQINKVNSETLEKQKLLMDEYKKHLDSLQFEYDQKVKDMEDLRSVKIQELTKKANQDPEAVLGNIAHKFGFEIIPVPEEIQ